MDQGIEKKLPTIMPATTFSGQLNKVFLRVASGEPLKLSARPLRGMPKKYAVLRLQFEGEDLSKMKTLTVKDVADRCNARQRIPRIVSDVAYQESAKTKRIKYQIIGEENVLVMESEKDFMDHLSMEMR